MRLLVRVHRDQFILDGPEAIARIRADIEAAARRDGGFVTMGSGDAPEVLITASTPVFITAIPEADPDDYADDSAPATPAFMDIDTY